MVFALSCQLNWATYVQVSRGGNQLSSIRAIAHLFEAFFNISCCIGKKYELNSNIISQLFWLFRFRKGWERETPAKVPFLSSFSFLLISFFPLLSLFRFFVSVFFFSFLSFFYFFFSSSFSLTLLRISRGVNKGRGLVPSYKSEGPAPPTF